MWSLMSFFLEYPSSNSTYSQIDPKTTKNAEEIGFVFILASTSPPISQTLRKQKNFDLP